jgi:DNA-binding NtrC family response regulator
MGKILIIDDDEVFRGVMSRLIRRSGHLTWTAENGKAGEALFHQIHPDLTIIDVWMPEQDGLQTLRQIQAHRPDAKVLVISGQPTGSGMPVFEVASVLGASDTMRKPFSATELIEKVEALLKPSGSCDLERQTA